ncbi:MAG: UDP-N-acetylglucosamine 1-carboxyvinyltransferase, partial [Bacteroidetes bacterium]|nr:UDP-N-acetylglucosamine 1-carboxyvinyltransferase [Bacteroidota bacterium]
MGKFIIQGGHELKGEIMPQGAKNEALQVICAVLLTQEPVIIKNIPKILDVLRLIDVLSSMGVEVTPLSEHEYKFQAKEVHFDFIKSQKFMQLSSAIRASIMIIGPLLGRFGKAYAATPGGDKIGRRPLTTHFEGFFKLGASFKHLEKENIYELSAPQLTGDYMLL